MDSNAPLKLLILDDEQDFLDVCQQWMSDLPSRPEVFAVNTGSRALALLESEPFSVLLTDLRMPNMDGFQVLAIVRRRYPGLRIVVMTGAVEEQFRSRAYAMGIDLYVEKPKGPKETQLFLDCIESLLERNVQAGGFRGMQNKPLVDIIQMECLTQSSGVLKISSGTASGLIWLDRGAIVDASCGGLTAEPAFREILSWKVGSFELLPPESTHRRTIFTSAQGLLLDIAQSIDEEQAASSGSVSGEPGEPLKLARIGRTKGIEFLACQQDAEPVEQWSCENAEAFVHWAQQTLQEFCSVGDALKTGDPKQIEGFGPHWHVAAARVGKTTVVAGFDRRLTPQKVRETAKQVFSQWES